MPLKGLHNLYGHKEGEFRLTEERYGREQVLKNSDCRTEATGTILLAEDDASMRGLIQLVLEARGFRVIATVNGSEALETYRTLAHSIRVVISDVGMPGLSGVDLFREIVLINPAVKIILISGHLESHSLSQLRKAGLRHFIQKPFSPDLFLQTLDTILAEP